MAYSRDPRVLAHKKKQEAERAARKAAKQAQREQRALEEAQEEAKRQQQLKEEEERVKKEKEDFNKNLRKKRTRLRQLCAKLRLSSPYVPCPLSLNRID